MEATLQQISLRALKRAENASSGEGSRGAAVITIKKITAGIRKSSTNGGGGENITCPQKPLPQTGNHLEKPLPSLQR